MIIFSVPYFKWLFFEVEFLCSFSDTYKRLGVSCFFLLHGRRDYLSTLKIEVATSSETLLRMYQRVCPHIPGGRTCNIHNPEGHRPITVFFPRGFPRQNFLRFPNLLIVLIMYHQVPKAVHGMTKVFFKSRMSLLSNLLSIFGNFDYCQLVSMHLNCSSGKEERRLSRGCSVMDNGRRIFNFSEKLDIWVVRLLPNLELISGKSCIFWVMMLSRHIQNQEDKAVFLSASPHFLLLGLREYQEMALADIGCLSPFHSSNLSS